MGTHTGTLGVYELLSGQVDPQFPPGVVTVVNPAESPPTGWGDFNAQQFQSAHTNALPTNESAEQGYGVGPERKWAHYPHATNPNPFRRMAAFQRDGGDAYSLEVYRPEDVAYWPGGLAYEAAAAPVKVRQRPGAVANQAPSQPFVATVAPLSPGGY
ncbi:MAG TPA: hypothetical protein VF032_19475 [Thermoleophilaceae bacterium]